MFTHDAATAVFKPVVAMLLCHKQDQAPIDFLGWVSATIETWPVRNRHCLRVFKDQHALPIDRRTAMASLYATSYLPSRVFAPAV